MKYLATTFLLIISLSVNAANEQSHQTKISRILSYTNYGDGDIAIELENSTGKTCEGYWISKGDKGYNANLSMLIAAYQANTTIAVWGEPNNKWPGSSSYFCRLYLIEYL